jgi:hypothetical protein
MVWNGITFILLSMENPSIDSGMMHGGYTHAAINIIIYLGVLELLYSTV